MHLQTVSQVVCTNCLTSMVKHEEKQKKQEKDSSTTE